MRAERIDLIESYIQKNKSVSLDTLCKEFSVSKNTIRRDVETLVKQGCIKKVYGGVTVCDTSPALPLLSYSERGSQNPSEKDAICRLAAQHIMSHDIIYVDTGTTCLNLIDYITDTECTIITNSLQLFLKAVSFPKLTVISMPGKLMRETLSFIGPEAVDFLATYNISKAFMASTGVTIKNGMTNASSEEYTVKKAVLTNSTSTYLLADHSKFGQVSLMTYGALGDLDYLITDREPAREYIDFCEEHGVMLQF